METAIPLQGTRFHKPPVEVAGHLPRPARHLGQDEEAHPGRVEFSELSWG